MDWPERIVIVDLEATCWDKAEHKPLEMETIEIGAVLVNNSYLEATKELDLFIRPTRHPMLSDFCRELTSISQEQVDMARPFPEVWQQFLNWLGDNSGIWLASWGSFDPMQLKQDCAHHGLAYPLEGRHLDLKKMFGAHFGDRKFGMKRALRKIELELEGKHHRGIDDARNIYRLYRWLRSNS